MTWKWMLTRIRDGNGIAPPRNLIDLVTKAQEAQLRKEARTATEYDGSTGGGVIQSDAIKRGLAALSDERMEDTLLAEAGEHATLIEQFRDGRAEHNGAIPIAQRNAVPRGRRKLSSPVRLVVRSATRRAHETKRRRGLQPTAGGSPGRTGSGFQSLRRS
jgi:hypothetical protein